MIVLQTTVTLLLYRGWTQQTYVGCPDADNDKYSYDPCHYNMEPVGWTG